MVPLPGALVKHVRTSERSSDLIAIATIFSEHMLSSHPSAKILPKYIIYKYKPSMIFHAISSDKHFLH